MSSFDQDMLDELNLLLKFPTDSLLQGLKIHHDASQAMVNAASRLYSKGLVTQPDGGYLTDLGIDLADHARHIQSALCPRKSGH
ncbi:DNA-binding protein [Alteromonas sp. KUL156]|uniref:TIGR02647 family protein n=1 Tax=Alteromonas sp. KUL106 TaxID=2480799 RepID=UPI0012E49674|nr:TIGR02647 family protein [Alteromonas sp. KUL106]GFD69123.1 DNA-binding protein [Alteromonas sp. KUL106]GFD81620.1 DNA-binding protein [Tenacibaculum sp. KUL118]GFD94415.1 DNA-binding protein [Alteromonas sp. KUL154]GFD98773.1 DNA-binding protein [Alteromonas sp. KUL156]